MAICFSDEAPTEHPSSQPAGRKGDSWTQEAGFERENTVAAVSVYI